MCHILIMVIMELVKNPNCLLSKAVHDYSSRVVKKHIKEVVYCDKVKKVSGGENYLHSSGIKKFVAKVREGYDYSSCLTALTGLASSERGSIVLGVSRVVNQLPSRKTIYSVNCLKCGRVSSECRCKINGL